MRDLLLLAIMVGLIPIILMRPWIGIAAWFWVGLMAPHSLTWGFMKTFPIAMVIGLTTLVALLMARDRRPIPFNREMILLLLWVSYITMTSAFAVNPTGAWDFWQHFMKVVLITVVTPMLVYGQTRIIMLLLVITFSLGFYGFKGGLFTITTGGAHSVMGPDGTYLSGNTYIGIAMIMVLPLILVSARMFYHQWIDWKWPLTQRLSKPAGLAMYGVFWLTGLAILATYSRGAFLGVLVIAPFLFWRMQRKWLMIALAILAVGVIGVSAPDRLVERWQSIQTYEEDTSSMQRIQAWGVNWNMAKERPLTGMGFRFGGMGYDWWITYANFEGHWRHVLSPHSIYFGVMAQHGFGGLAVFLLLLGGTFMSLNHIRKTAIHQTGQIWLSEYAWAIQLSLIGYGLAGAFLDVAYFNLLYAFIALAIIMRRELEQAAHVGETQGETTQGEKISTEGSSIRFPDFVALTPTERDRRFIDR